MPKRCMAFPQSMRNEDQRLEYPKPLIDLWNNEVWACVQQTEVEEYTQPIGVWGAFETDDWWEFDDFPKMEAICYSPCGNFVSGLTTNGGWILIWCRWNWSAQRNIGRTICAISTERRW